MCIHVYVCTYVCIHVGGRKITFVGFPGLAGRRVQVVAGCLAGGRDRLRSPDERIPSAEEVCQAAASEAPP